MTKVHRDCDARLCHRIYLSANSPIVAAVSVCTIVNAAQENVHGRHGSGLQLIAVDAAIVTD